MDLLNKFNPHLLKYYKIKHNSSKIKIIIKIKISKIKINASKIVII